jgi:hypothetical protein
MALVQRVYQHCYVDYTTLRHDCCTLAEADEPGRPLVNHLSLAFRCTSVSLLLRTGALLEKFAKVATRK